MEMSAEEARAKALLFAEWQIKNQTTAGYFAAAILGSIALFTIVHWTEILLNKYTKRASYLKKGARFTTRLLRRTFGAKVIGGIHIHPGRATLVLVYLGINAALSFYDRPDKVTMGILAKRFGWMALVNMSLAIFLGLKNTPLSPLAGHSFESVNILHRCVGYTTLVFVILHAGTYVPALSRSGDLDSIMTEPAQYAGVAAGASIVAISVSAIGFLRRRHYELFYVIHVVLVTAVLITVGFHRPEIAKKALIIIIVMGSAWFADKSFRFLRYFYFGAGNFCTLTPLADEATRVTMYRSIPARPGSTAFLWIPGIRLAQTHPFTLISTEPAEFVVKARDGFTRDLYIAACKTPGAKFRATVDGPYGTVPDVLEYDKVVLFAGGSGITFTLALALQWVRDVDTAKSDRTLDFIWTVQREANATWFDSELSELKASPHVNLCVHVSGSDSAASSQLALSPSPQDSDSEKASTIDARPPIATSSSNSILKASRRGRPDVKNTLHSVMQGQSQDRQILVAGCGPPGLLDGIRQAVAENTVVNAPSIKSYLVHFSF